MSEPSNPVNEDTANPISGEQLDTPQPTYLNRGSAPGIVRNMPSAAALGIVLSVGAIIVGFPMLGASVLSEHPEGHHMVGLPPYAILPQLLGMFCHIGLIGIMISLPVVARGRDRFAWDMVRTLAFTGLLAFPVGTVMCLYILHRWSEPETKRWFDF